MSWFTELLNPVMDIVKVPLEEWQKRKTIRTEQDQKQLDNEHEIRLKKMEIAYKLAEQGQQVEADWDARAQEEQKHSWKDEWFVFLFSIPLILSFIPYTQPYVLKGFETLAQTPKWYMLLVMGIVAATFGLRWLISKRN